MKFVHERSMRNSLRNLHRAINENNMMEVRQNLRLGFNLDNFYNGSIASQVALKKGNYEACSLLFHNGADVNLQIEDGNTLLHYSLIGNIDIDKVHFLLENGADPDISNYSDQTPLHVVCERGEVEAARMLIDKCVYVNRCDLKGETALMKSSKRGHAKVVEMLVAHGADVEWKDNEGCTSLMRAVEEKNDQVVEVLLKAGCNPNTHDKYHTTPLMMAARNDDVTNMEALIKYGALIDMCDLRKQTAFTEAVCHMSMGAVTSLMQKSCDVNMASFPLKQTALHHCINKSTQAHGQREEHRDLIKKLLEYEATHIDTPDQSGCSPLYLACLHNLPDVAEQLLEHGARKTTTTNNNYTLLHACAISNCVSIALMLIKEGVRTDTPTNKNESPLYLAVFHNADQQIISGLIGEVNGVDRQEDSKGHTALHAAVLNKNKWAVEALLQAGCDANITDKSNRTALWHGCDIGDEGVVEVLLESGVVEVGRGEDVLYVAVRRRKMRMVKMLLNARVPLNRFSEGFKTPLYEATEQNHLPLISLLIQHGANPSAHHSISRLCGCCTRYTDTHPHLELHPLFAAVQNDNIKACSILVTSCYHYPLHQLTTLRDIIFRTNYVTDAKLARKSIMQFAAFFTHVMGTPRSLKEVCRGVVRGMLGEYSRDKVEALSVPDGVKHFLNFRHLDVVINETKT